MLMWLSEQLLFIDPGFSVFQYLTLRGILAACTAMAISMLVGPMVIERLNVLLPMELPEEPLLEEAEMLEAQLKALLDPSTASEGGAATNAMLYG